MCTKSNWVCPVSLQQSGLWAVSCTACSLQLSVNNSAILHILLHCAYSMQGILESVNIGTVLQERNELCIYIRSKYAVKFNIFLTRLDMYTSSTEHPSPPGPSSTAGNELLHVVCRLIIHNYRTQVYALHFQLLHNLGVLQDLSAQEKKVTEYYVMSCSTPLTSSPAHHVCKHGIWAVICTARSLQMKANNSAIVHILLSRAYSMQGILESVNIGTVLLEQNELCIHSKVQYSLNTLRHVHVKHRTPFSTWTFQHSR